jgi:hypothetical protein
MLVLLPLIVLLGERADEPLPPETADALLYWLLVATIRNRYSGDDWRELLERERTAASPLTRAPEVMIAAWEGEPVTFPVTSID